MRKQNGPQAPHRPALDFLKYLGPGLLVTVGFIDPGNWASNLAAGSQYGYRLLWVVTLSTVMLALLQHNAAHLGIATGLCLSESAATHMKKPVGYTVLGSAMLAAVATAMAEILGGALALNLLFHLPLPLGAVMVLAVVLWFLFGNAYKRLEKIIIGFVSVIGFAFLAELFLVEVDWGQAAVGLVTPAFPAGSVMVVMSILGAVVMPHNLFLHSEVIQSRQWNLEDEKTIKRQLKFEFLDTITSMGIGWAINSALVIVAAAVFFGRGIVVSDIAQAQNILTPLLGGGAAVIFAVALLFSGLSSSMTAGMAGGSIFAGLFREPYDIKDSHSKWGVALTLGAATLIIFCIQDSFSALVYSQMLLSIQLPITIFAQIHLTSSKAIMGQHANGPAMKVLLYALGAGVTALNLWLFFDIVTR